MPPLGSILFGFSIKLIFHYHKTCLCVDIIVYDTSCIFFNTAYEKIKPIDRHTAMSDHREVKLQKKECVFFVELITKNSFASDSHYKTCLISSLYLYCKKRKKEIKGPSLN